MAHVINPTIIHIRSSLSADASWIHTEAAISGHNSLFHKVKTLFLFHAIFIQSERKFPLASVGSRGHIREEVTVIVLYLR